MSAIFTSGETKAPRAATGKATGRLYLRPFTEEVSLHAPAQSWPYTLTSLAYVVLREVRYSASVSPIVGRRVLPIQALYLPWVAMPATLRSTRSNVVESSGPTTC